MRILTVLYFSVLLTACVPLSTGLNGTTSASGELPADLQLFKDGVEQMSQQQSTEALLSLKKDFPGSVWAKYADDILSLNNLILQQEKQVKKLEDKVARCTSENQHLQKELDTSNQRLEALRELTIELELKQP